MLRPVLMAAGEAASTLNVSDLLSNGVNSITSDIFTALGVVVPAILTITGAVVAVKFGIAWVKKLKG